MADDVSTRFPFISLEKALARAETIFEGDKGGRSMPIPTAFELWNYSPKSSGGFQTIGALKAYGLFEDEGSNEDRKVKLTSEARRFFLDERDEVRAAMLTDFALRPALFSALWEKDGWKNGIPADTVARSHLKIDRGLNDQSSRSALSIFKENFVFAGLKASSESLSATSESAQPIRDVNRYEEFDPEITGSRVMSPRIESPHDAPFPSNLPTQDVRLVGERVVIAANVDLKGLRKLRRQLAMFEQMLIMDDDDLSEGEQ